MIVASGLIALTLVGCALICGYSRLRFHFPVEMRFSDLWRWQGTIGRGAYAFVGITGFAIKHNIDRIVATTVFGRPFTVLNYWISPIDPVRLRALSRGDAIFLATMLLIALPFVWVGVSMTIRRLRSAKLPV